MAADELTLLEREEIRAGIEGQQTLTAIARRLRRHRRTISNEVNRNGGRQRYSAVRAQTRAEQARRRPKVPKLVTDPALAAHVSERLEAKDSPMTISIELARGIHGIQARISHECIYQAVYAHGARGLRRGLHEGLHRRRRCRKHRRGAAEPAAKTKSPLGEFALIGMRPPIADARVEVGHLEGDLIVGAYNRSALAAVFDRASRHLWMAEFCQDHGADATLAALVEILERIPAHLRHTITWDQGREMARHHDLAELCGIDVYFCDAHSPWQRPTNENGNGLIRRYVGKGTDLSRFCAEDLRRIEARINTIPRRSLGWSTAHDVYTAAVAMTG